MTLTRPQIRQHMLDKHVLRGAQYGTATAGQLGSLTDTAKLMIGGQPQSLLANRFLYRPAAATASDHKRRIGATGWTPYTGVLVHAGPQWTIAPLASADDGSYELWPFDPDFVNDAMTLALTTRCHTLQLDDIDLAGYDSANEWDISVAPFSVGIADVYGDLLEILQINGTPPQASFTPWSPPDPNNQGRLWIPMVDGTTQKVYFNTPPSGKLRLVWRKPFTALTTEALTTTADLELVTWATFYELFIGLERRANTAGEPSELWGQLKQQAYGQYWQRRSELMGPYASEVIHRQVAGSLQRPTVPVARAGARGGLRGW